jgi:uncharacterized membrane protein
MDFWRKPALRRAVYASVLGLLVAGATLAIDRGLPAGWLAGWQPPASGARVLLGAVTGSIITVSALVFWVRGMFVQLSAGEFSSRVLRWYLADRKQEHVLDFFVAVFCYTAAVTLAIDGSHAPPLSTALSLGLSITALIVVIVTIRESARVTELTTIMSQIAQDTVTAVRQTHPDRGQGITRHTGTVGGDDAALRTVHATEAGWVGDIDEASMLAVLPAQATMRVWTRVGSFVLRDSIVADVRGVDGDDLAALADAVHISSTRQVTHDVERGLRNLVDIVLQALTVGSRDATSAYEAINYLAWIVHEILLRDLPNNVRVGADGRRIVRMAELTYADYVRAAFDPIREIGAGYDTIASVLCETLTMLSDALAWAGLENRGDALQQQIALVLDQAEHTDLAAADRVPVRCRPGARPDAPEGDP